MTENLNNALLITLIGMGLVFVTILLLWGLMALMVHLLRDKSAAPVASEDGEAQTSAEIPPETANDIKLRVAAAAVAAAFAMQRSSAGMLLSQTESGMSAWQTAMRASALHQHSQLFTRKS